MAMVSLRAPLSWKPGIQLDHRESGDVEASVGRAGLLLARRRCNVARCAVHRRTRRIRANSRPHGGVSRAVSAFGAYGASTDAGDLTEVMDFSNNPLSQACRRLRLESADELQDLIASLILSECVYKKLELDEAGVVAKVTEFVSSFPPGWVELQAVQLSLSGIPQHYLIATSPTSMYVAFMGTKQFQDILADANLLHTPVWAESARLAADRQSIPAAHRGFLERARAIHVEQLYELAVSRGLRLVLCGHSLGGAVAKLCTLRLLRELPDWPRPRVRCIAFATPAVGNAALAELVESAGWAGHFATYYLPEDQLVRLISFSQARTSPGSSSGGTSSSSGGTGSSSGAAAGSAAAAGVCRRGDTAAGNGSGGRKGSRARAGRHRKGKEGSGAGAGVSGTGAGVVGGEGMGLLPPPPTRAAAAASAAEPARLDKAALGRLNTAAATAAAATDVQQMQLQPQAQLPKHLARAPSASSIASSSSSSCASGDTTTSSTDVSSTGPSIRRHRRRDDSLSFGGAVMSLESQNDAYCSSASSSCSPISRSVSIGDRTRSSCSSGGGGGGSDAGSLTGYIPLQTRAAAALAAQEHGRSGGGGGGGGVGRMSLVESLDEDQVGVALAMEEILSPGPDELEAAAAAGVALSGQTPMDLAAAQREALYGNAGGSWGLRLALGRKRVMRRLRRLAARARIPLPKALLPVSRYHTFGAQWFLTEHGALSPEELENQLRAQREPDQQLQQLQQPVHQQQQQQQAMSSVAGPAMATPAAAGATAAAGGSAPPEAARGFFSFHRMVAYRQRYTDLISRLMRDDAEGVVGVAELKRPQLPAVTAAAAAATATAADDLVQLQQGGVPQGGNAATANMSTAAVAVADAMSCAPPHSLAAPYTCTVQLCDSLLPRISVQRAVLQGVLPESRVVSAAAAAASETAPAEAFQTRAHAKSHHQHQGDSLTRLSPGEEGQQSSALAAKRRAGSYPAGGDISSSNSSGGGGGGGAPAGRSGDAAARPPAPVAPVVGHLLRWVWGSGGGGAGVYRSPGSGVGRARGSPDELVRLDLELEGHNLQYCRKVSVMLVRDGVVGTAPVACAGNVNADASASTNAASQAGPGAGAAAAAAVGGQVQARWVPFPAALGGGSVVAGDGSSIPGATAAGRVVAPRQNQQPGALSSAPQPTAAAASQLTAMTAKATADMSPPPLAASSPAVRLPGHTNPGPMAAVPSSSSSATAVPCEVVQVLYAQPYSDEANPPPLHPVSLFRNTLHHFAGNFMRRCRPQGQGQDQGQVGWGSFASLAATSATPASAPSSAGAGGGSGPLMAPAAAGMNGHVGPWRRFRFQQQNNRPASNNTAAITEGVAGGGVGGGGTVNAPPGRHTSSSSCVKARSDECASFSMSGRSPGGFIGGMAATRTDGAAAAAAAVATDAVVAMPSRLLLRVTLPLSVAQGLLDGTLPARLVVSARSDFHALSDVPVAVHRPRVAILGTSPYAASLVQAALSAPAALAASRLDARHPAGGTAGGGALGASAGLAAWVPPPVTWALSAVFSAVATANVRRAATAAAGAAAVARAGTIAASQAGTAGSVPSASLPPPPPPAPAPSASAAGAAAPLPSARPGSSLSARTHNTLGTKPGPAAAGVKAAGQRGKGGFAPWWIRLAAQGRVLRVRTRWGIRQSLAAAAVGAAAASAAGATGAAAAVGAAAVVASTVAAFHSDGGVSVFANAAVTMAAVVAAAAAAATAFTGSEVAVLVAAAASAAAVAMAAATSSGVGISSEQPSPPPPPPPMTTPQQQRPAPSKETATAPGKSPPAALLLRAIPHGLPISIPAPRLGPASSRTAAGTASVSAGTSAAASAPGLASVSESRTGSTSQWGPPRWVLRFGAAAQAASGRAQQNRSTGSTKTTSSATQLSAAAAESSRRSGPWFPPPLGGTAAQLRRMATAQPGTGATASVAVAADVQPTRGRGGGGGGGGGGVAAAAAVSLAQLRSQLLRRLTAGSGRAALPLPPRVLSDGLELCNVMVEPASRTWGSGRSGSGVAIAANAAGQRHLLPLRRPRGGSGGAPAPPPPAQLELVPAAQLWRGRCYGSSPAGGEAPQSSTAAAAPAPAPAAPATNSVSAAVAPGVPPASLLLGPGAAAAAAARLAVGGAATAAVAATAALGDMPFFHGGPRGADRSELVGVAPFVAVQRMEEGLRRQVLQRGLWWRALLGGVVGALLRPVALVGMLGRLPGWGLQVLRRGHSGAGGPVMSHGSSATCHHRHHHPLETQPGGERPPSSPAQAGSVAAAPGGGSGASTTATASASPPPRTSSSDWGVLVVVASCRDPLRVLRSRDMEALRNRATEAACPLVPVLLTCAESPPGRRAAALRTLAAACGVSVSEVRVVRLDAALLHQPAAAIPRADLAAVWQGRGDVAAFQRPPKAPSNRVLSVLSVGVQGLRAVVVVRPSHNPTADPGQQPHMAP
ncbi:hypothetical protein VOLCADRAFT_86206 [Volvox carteri f. nagariensis]|uniref:Fungal lipase-type domain-containing protein n=1 Tax=Volvox carteri f. nagariensis TaxID=3068 RepID=D8TI63_VOLCA|nr:uncharacterized protein VOLCADRAFT_86206 [Volvox carteri f. nagariensis]EFJ53181.1 hypothetical protein VOLCADRAFT_86206 [Volvox carteri f. nagariensis]|eukprot:XP_002946186.1 hypothetical protein VOLCADRAFT_86206 [Volvox carteri f. nagariensis]